MEQEYHIDAEESDLWRSTLMMTHLSIWCSFFHFLHLRSTVSGINTFHTQCWHTQFLLAHSEMLSPAFSPVITMQWASMPSDTNGVESLNKCSIDHSKRSKSLKAHLEFTYRQDNKTTWQWFWFLQATSK